MEDKILRFFPFRLLEGCFFFLLSQKNTFPLKKVPFAAIKRKKETAATTWPPKPTLLAAPKPPTPFANPSYLGSRSKNVGVDSKLGFQISSLRSGGKKEKT